MEILILNGQQSSCDAVAGYVTETLPEAKITKTYSDQETYKAISTTTFNLAIVDIVLADKHLCEGFKVIEMLRAAQPRCNIIVWTTSHQVEHGRRSYQLGVKLYICNTWLFIDSVHLLQEQIKLLV